MLQKEVQYGTSSLEKSGMINLKTVEIMHHNTDEALLTKQLGLCHRNRKEIPDLLYRPM